MPTIVRYDHLTWQEVATLPRDLPLVLPLGEGFDEAAIASSLAADTLVMLPPLPYGWRDSVLPVSEAMLRRVVAGVFRAPLEEAFTRLVVVHDGPEDLAMAGVQHLRLDRARKEAASPLACTPQRVILIPCGHTEQHGFHLPMNTDTVIIGAIAEGVLQRIPAEAEMLPVLPYGVSMFRASFAGTFNLGGRTYEDFLLEVLDVLIERGADRFYLMSGHGGNSSFLHNVVKYAGNNHPGVFTATAWLHTSGHRGAPAIEQHRRSPRGGMGHACELETAYLLHLCPELCHMDRVVDETDFVSTPNYYMDWLEGGALIASPPWEDDTATGSYGAGSLATAENGARWLEAAVLEKIDHVREIHEQQNRRLARRLERGIDYRIIRSRREPA